MKHGAAVMIAVGAMLLAGSGRAQTPPSVSGPVAATATGGPDVLCLIYQRPGLGDQIDITYAHTIPQAQAHRDVAALEKASGWTINSGQMSDGIPPVQNKFGPMTSVTFEVTNAIQSETHTLPVEAFVTAFRPYKRLALIFLVDSHFKFQGWRQYADNHVKIALDQHGSAYTYRVDILNSQFDRLDLPLTAQAATATAASGRSAGKSPLPLILGIVVAAAAIGALVFVVTQRLTAAPEKMRRTEDETPQEEETTLGGRG